MAKILVVDDDAFSRELIATLLGPEGHEVVEASSGEEALTIAQATPLDLVLLDVILPGIHGFDIALQLKAYVPGEFLPVVILTSLTDNTSRLLGLKKGADDFLTKPVNAIELLIRVKHLLELRDQGRNLRRNNIELLEAGRFREEMVNLIVHDLKNPLSVVLGNLEYLAESPQPLEASYAEALKDSQTAAHRVLRLLTNMLDLARMEVQRLELRRAETDLTTMIDQLLQQRSRQAQARGFTIHGEVAAGLVVAIDADLMTRVIENLLDNAARYTPRDGRIHVGVTVHDDRVKIAIGNSGRAVPAEARAVIFEKYGQSASGSHGRMNLGLGLYFCRLAIEAHVGKIWVEETEPLPTVFVIDLPLRG